MRYKQYKYTVSDVARLVGKTADAVRHDVSRGIVDLSDLRSVGRYLERHGVLDGEEKAVLG